MPKRYVVSGKNLFHKTVNAKDTIPFISQEVKQMFVS